MVDHRKAAGSQVIPVTKVSAAASVQGGCGFKSGSVTFAFCPLFLCRFSSGSLGSYPQSKSLHVGSSGRSKFFKGVTISVDGCLSACRLNQCHPAFTAGIALNKQLDARNHLLTQDLFMRRPKLAEIGSRCSLI